MSFNKEQREYMDSLAAIPDEKRCWCGWGSLGRCLRCDKSTSLADRLRVSCRHRQCRAYPRQNDPEGKITHTVTCPESIQTDAALISSDDWSKLLTIAEYGVWSTAFPKIKDMFDEYAESGSVHDTVKKIVEGLPRNLQDTGKILMEPKGYHDHKPTSAKLLADLFLAKV
jgi:hypothetical protein